MSMNPGATTVPATSMVRAAGSVDGRRDAGDRVAADRDVAPIPGAAGPVDDSGVAEQQVVAARLERPARRQTRAPRRTQPRRRHRRPARAERMRTSQSACPQNREAVSVTSAVAQAFFSRASTPSGLVLLALREERLVQSEERPAVLAIALEVLPVDDLRFRRPARRRGASRRASAAPARASRAARCRSARPRAARRDRSARWRRRTVFCRAAMSPLSTSSATAHDRHRAG